MPDYYHLLGIAYDDPPQKIRARYRLLALAVHPDTGDAARKEELAGYAQAYRILGNLTRREQYNRELGITVRPRGLHPGQPLYQRLAIPSNVAETGGVVTLNFIRYEPCSLCWLAGCQRCNQQGMIPEQVCTEVKIVPGTKHGTTLFIEAQGGRSEPGGPRGELFVYVSTIAG